MPNPACLKSVNFSKLYNIVRLAEEFIWLATQEKLLREMVLVGEAALAHEYAVVNFGVDPGVLQLDPAELAADEAARAAVYLQLALPPEAVHFCGQRRGPCKGSFPAAGSCRAGGSCRAWAGLRVGDLHREKQQFQSAIGSQLAAGEPAFCRKRSRTLCSLHCCFRTSSNMSAFSCFLHSAGVIKHMERRCHTSMPTLTFW